ncbi:MAG: helicase HerA domain-containing protein, partial [Vicinamibacteria bacterium]
MSKIALGKSGKKTVEIDLDVLLRTRGIVQGNSGCGKTFTLKRILEQLFGKVQVIVLDIEGEFASLREEFGFVLVGKGGETPADCRSAAMLAHRLLELRASTICDLYEMKASERHRWVRLFLEAVIDAPKHLWHPVIFVIDEIHTLCPEKGAGESEAADAIIGLATRGRKRGYCLIGATQRIGKFRKDAAAELLNIFVGMTFIDIDRKRAAESLGIPKSEERKLFDVIKVTEPGNFWALGSAVSKERVLVHVGPLKTT